jgi:hypothetical protein
MIIGSAFLSILLVIVAIGIFMEIIRFRHKVVILLLIVLIIFAYFTFSNTMIKKDIDLKTFEGVKEGSQLYLSWLVSSIKNVKTFTANAVDEGWSINESIIEGRKIFDNKK